MNVGGITLCVLSLVQNLKQDFDVKVVAGPHELNEGNAQTLADELCVEVQIIHEMQRPINLKQDYKAYKKLKQIIKEFKPDIVHTHAAKPGAVGRLAAYFSKVPVIVHTYHGHVFHSYFGKLKSQFYIQIERFMAKLSSALIAISPQQKLELVNQFKISNKDKIQMVFNGLNLEKFNAPNKQQIGEAFRQQWGVKNNEIAIGIIGRLAPIKNIGYFVNAINQLKNRGVKNIKALIIGDGEELKSLKAQVAALQLENDVVFTSWVKNIEQAYAGLDIVTLCSKNEGTPTTIIEAQAAGLAIASVNVGGVADIVEAGETALLNNLDNFDNYVNNLKTLIEDKQKRTEMGELAKNYAFVNFSIQIHTEQVKQLYAHLLG